jgi:NAD(P)-dependent dehydrogenase (short-subunit alcohol dehydrogenase family)
MRRVVVITGASAGVGRATARRFAAHGAAIGLIARDEDRLVKAAQEVSRAGGTGLPLPLDVADDAAVDEAAARVEREFGPIDVWINNAMATVFARADAITPDEYRRATEVTYLGFVWGTLAALRRMKPRDRGTIVQVGSALAYRAIPLQAPYCAAKHAVEGFTESLRTELMHDGSSVRVTMVQLPAHNTPQFDWGRAKMPRHPQPVPPIFQPELAAEAIEHAALHPRREIWVGWPAVKAILGNRVLPWLGDRMLAKSGFDSQQTDHQLNGERYGNLFEPVPGDPGAHGSFDVHAKTRSWLWSLNAQRGRFHRGNDNARAAAGPQKVPSPANPKVHRT